MAKTEAKEPSELDKLGREYSILCTQLGEFEYKRRMFEIDIQTATKRLQEVNKKAADIRSAQDKFEKKETLDG